jgi:putative hemolysin
VQVDAGMRIDEANERLRLGLPEGDYDTLAGFMLARLGRIPRVGEELHYDGVRLVVSEMKGVKIERVLVQRK